MKTFVYLAIIQIPFWPIMDNLKRFGLGLQIFWYLLMFMKRFLPSSALAPIQASAGG